METSGGSSMKAFFKRFSRTREAAATDIPPMQDPCQCEQEQCKILIVCKGNSFSQGIADYAITMAKKTRTSLVALNLDETGRDFAGFRAQAERNIANFSTMASNAGLAFEHEVRQGDEDSVVSQMHKTDPQFRYVMDDSVVICKNKTTIPVYTRATLRAK